MVLLFITAQEIEILIQPLAHKQLTLAVMIFTIKLLEKIILTLTVLQQLKSHQYIKVELAQKTLLLTMMETYTPSQLQVLIKTPQLNTNYLEILLIKKINLSLLTQVFTQLITVFQGKITLITLQVLLSQSTHSK